MKKLKFSAVYLEIILILFFVSSCNQHKEGKEMAEHVERDSTTINREYTLEASMLGYFAPDGTRNPTLKANKGDRVRITIINMENMTHDVSMEKLGVKSNTLNEVGESTSITFWAESDDTYFCTIPGHRAAGMVGDFKIVEGNFSSSVIAGIVPFKNGKPINVGFERGNLSDWQAQGDAFKNPLFTRNDSIHKLNTKIGFDGDYFLSSGGIGILKKREY
ncbi:cupredoxin domain-containing protein [Maribacter litopenaei]|uniref:Cupredoxin domain-containing protein n=1 Tax=Maribacter litopenaei TaxID=2976127 RepID=A0ABY5Y9W0_9FLAO|nr:cupredoxin domain-containing protein [Maribacter litopenaei]UWX55838.1 cupredoxin domain-containing protein [Maribacter litopenaei]